MFRSYLPISSEGGDVSFQDVQAYKDNALAAITIVVFWPAAFFVGGDRGNAVEVGRLKGEMAALEQASIKKNCGIQFRQG